MLTRRVLLFPGILCFGSMGGFFWSFSVVIMPGLERADPMVALVAMQDINFAVRNALFGVGFFGAALIAVALVVQSVYATRFTGIVQTGAALLYLAGVLGVTAFGNVPLNETLAAVDPSSRAVDTTMANYLRDWADLNHIRTVSALVATAMLVWSIGQTKPVEI